MVYLMNNDPVNLKNFKAFLTSIEEAYRDCNRMNTDERAHSKQHQGN
jgi:hypothetical protein